MAYIQSLPNHHRETLLPLPTAAAWQIWRAPLASGLLWLRRLVFPLLPEAGMCSGGTWMSSLLLLLARGGNAAFTKESVPIQAYLKASMCAQ